MFGRVVVPLDGSEVSERALPAAREFAQLYGIPMLLVRAVDRPFIVGQVGAGGSGLGTGTGMPAAFVGNPAAADTDDGEAQSYIDRMVGHLRGEGFNVSGMVVQGQPAAAVSESFAASDLVVMSSHGRTGMARWFMGSVAEGILKRSSVPVLLIRE